VAISALLAVSSSAFQKRFALPPPPTKNDIERGRYLVEEVAKCPECHTPRKPDGELDDSAWLRGSSAWMRPLTPNQNWADRAPALAGLPGLTDEQAEKVLVEGTRRNGQALRAPMHIYHLTQQDARAIVAYLKSLPGEAH
jgi:mono/diheme cytochrome c family protein